MGVDHLALSCADLSAGCAALEALGLQVVWRAEDVESPAEKAPFLRRSAARHSLAFARAAEGVAIELTMHGPLPAHSAPAEPLLRAPMVQTTAPAAPSGASAWGEALGVHPVRTTLSPFAANCWLAPAAAPAGPTAMALPVADLEAEQRFWTDGLGATSDPRGGRAWRLIRLGSAMPRWRLGVLLVSGGTSSLPALDDAGFTCVALLSTDCEADAARAAREGARAASRPFDMELGGRRLRLLLLRSPSGCIIELVQICR